MKPYFVQGVIAMSGYEKYRKNALQLNTQFKHFFQNHNNAQMSINYLYITIG